MGARRDQYVLLMSKCRFLSMYAGHRLGKSCPLGFPLVLFYFMPSSFFVFLFRMVSGEGSGIAFFIAFSAFFLPLFTVLGFFSLLFS